MIMQFLITVLRRFIAPLLLSYFLAYTLQRIVDIKPQLREWFGFVAETSTDWYLQTFYNTFNTNREWDENECDNIIILDLQESISRKNIADLIKLVSNNSPRVIGLDVAFKDTIKTSQTNYLINTLANLDKHVPLVYGYAIEEESVIPDSLMIHKGFTNTPSVYAYTAYHDSCSSFALEMVRVAGYDLEKFNASKFVVNFRTKAFTIYPITADFGNHPEIIAKKVRDKIVLIGGLDYRTDKHHLPFYLEKGNDKPVAGTKLIAYELTSILSAVSDDYSRKTDIAHYHHYSHSSIFWDIVINVSFVLIYLIVYLIVANFQKKASWAGFIKPIWLTIMLCIEMYFSMKIITARCYYVPNVVFFMIMTVFVGYFCDLFDDISAPRNENNTMKGSVLMD